MIAKNKKPVKALQEWLAVWSERKAASLQMAARLQMAQDWRLRKRGKRMESCAELVLYRTCLNCGVRQVSKTALCRDRVCPLCNWRLANKRWVTLYAALRGLQEPDLEYWFVTLTVRNMRSNRLSATLQNMSKAWNRLMQRRTVKRQMLGWARSVEVTFDRERHLMHPHYHIIFVCRNGAGFSWPDFIQGWIDIVHEYGEYAHPNAQEYHKIIVESDQDTALLEAALETYKYTIKSQDLQDMPLSDFYNYARQIAGHRLTSTGGIIKTRIKTDLDEVDEEASEVCPACGSANLAEACMEWAGTTYRVI